MKNIVVKTLFALIIAVMMISLIALPVNAEEDSKWLDTKLEPKNASGTAQKARTIAGEILAVVQVVGISVAVIVLIIVAIKYISAAPNDKAEIKKHMVVYVVGAVILFAASSILGIIGNFAKSTIEGDETQVPKGAGGTSAASQVQLTE